MKESLDILIKVKQIEAPEYLYDKVLAKIAEQKQNVIPMKWVSVAAAVIFCLIAMEFIILSQIPTPQKSESIETLLPITNNNLYHD